jgi:hypothetical protein
VKKILVLLLLSVPLMGHSWYDATCCTEKDCRPVVKGEVTLTKDGWLVKPVDRAWSQVIPFTSYKVKPSMDVNMHICVGLSQIFCLYKPDPGT